MGADQSSPQSPEALEAETQAAAQRKADLNASIDEIKIRNKGESQAAASANDTAETTNGQQRAGIPQDSMAMRPKTSSQVSLPQYNILKPFNPWKQPLEKKRTLNSAQEKVAASSKRPAADSVIERSQSLSSIPKIPKRTSVASPQSPSRVEGGQSSAVGNEYPPKWYIDLKVPNSRDKGSSSANTLLGAFRSQITKCQTTARNGLVKQEELTRIRHKLHKIIFIEVNEVLLKSNRMLHNEDGLPQLFEEKFSKGVNWPFDVKADAREVYNKWCRRIFETDLFRGVLFDMRTVKTDKDSGKAQSDSIDPSYKAVVSSKFHGNGDLLNGQWWPTLLCALRDGAHGATVAGISGKAGEGAYSVFMSSGGHNYDDKDYGNEVKYCGTDSTDGSITEHTRRLLESVENGHPVRLLRSSKLKNAYAPKFGFRYDGLYDVVRYENLDGSNSRRQRHRFTLIRQPGQDPIRGGDGPESRPTEEEESQYRQHRAFTRKSNV